ncbi:MAG: pyruvate kinase [Nanoarchaeota archaeon]|nr:pyruvate kinase [Nanoarchaeota archaeon]
MKKTKIICTLGPQSCTREIIQELINNGMDCARLNCSHGNPEEKLEKINLVRDISDYVSIILDTKGPEIRTGAIQSIYSDSKSCDGEIYLNDGDQIILTAQDIIGTRERISISYKDLAKKVKPKQTIYIDDGLIELKVIEIKNEEIVCKVLNGGKLGSRKTVALPGLDIALEPITPEDLKNIEFAIKYNLDFIAVSFVKSKDEIIWIKNYIRKKGSQIKVIAKIETVESVENIKEIIEASDGIMVARGDLATDICPQNVPIVQKDIVKRCNIAAKPVIIATQMLDSMINNPRPTRAEVNDVANAIIDGADAIMLSGETASGRYPVKALKNMSEIAKATEKSCYFGTKKEIKNGIDDNIASFISKSVYHAANNLDIQAVIAATSSGFTARLISRFKLRIPIIAITSSLETYRQLSLSWGVYPILGEFAAKSRQVVIDSINLAFKKDLITKNDTVAVTAGVPVGQAGTTNLIEIHRIESFLLYNKIKE